MSGARCEDCRARGKPHTVANSRLRCQTQDLLRAAVSNIGLFSIDDRSLSECSPCPRAAETRLSAGRCCSHRCRQDTCTYARQRQARTSLPSSVPPLQIRHSAVSLLSVLVMTSVEPSAAWAASADSVWGSARPRPVSFIEFCT